MCIVLRRIKFKQIELFLLSNSVSFLKFHVLYIYDDYLAHKSTDYTNLRKGVKSY